jgi:hypothetical protein
MILAPVLARRLRVIWNSIPRLFFVGHLFPTEFGAPLCHDHSSVEIFAPLHFYVYEQQFPSSQVGCSRAKLNVCLFVWAGQSRCE